MPARNNLTHNQQARDNIQVGVLLDLLHKHALGEGELSPERVSSIRLLLAKALPDLQSITLQADVTAYLSAEPKKLEDTPEEWAESVAAPAGSTA
ncbi:MAG: hypothetical protein AAF526_13255 [Pseudomonadota bacterium]